MRSLIVFIRYVIGGGLAVLVQFATLAILVELYHFNPLISATVAFCVACAFNYPFQYYLTFKAQSSHAGTFIRYFIVASIMMGLNAAIFWGLTERLDVPYMYAQVVASAIIMFCNFIINRVYTFNFART